MDMLSFSRSHSLSYIDIDTSMDTSQDFGSSPSGVVWVPSQSPNPALQALMNEAENDRRSECYATGLRVDSTDVHHPVRPSTPIHQPTSWTYPLASTTSSTSLSTSISSAWHSSGNNSIDASYLPPLSGSSSSASSSSLAPRASEPSVSRRSNPLSVPHRRPLASSTSSANRPLRHSARPRSSSHSMGASKGKYNPKDDEPEALFFIELLKDASRQVDRNSEKKERAVREKEMGMGKEREDSLGRSGVDDPTGLDSSHLSAQPLTNTSNAFAMPSTRAPEKTSSTSISARKPESHGRVLAKTASLGAPGVHLVSGKSTPTSLPSPNLNCNLKLVTAPRLPATASNISNANHAIARKAKVTSNDDDSVMQDVIDLTETDAEWDRRISGPSSRADTTTYMQVDDEESDTGMDVSFFRPEPAPQTRVPAPKPKPQPPQPTRPSVPTQRARAGPPPLGMRRAPQLQPPQSSSTQGSKGATVPRFKPPLLAYASGSTHKNGSGSKPATTASSSRPPRGSAAKAKVVETTAQTSQDPDSSFDISFDVDADALEEAMKAYD